MNKVIKIGRESVEVSEEIYTEYFRMGRRERYLQSDVKHGRIDVDMEAGKITFVESKEDSIERLMELGTDFTGGQAVEDIACDRAMLFILQRAMEELCREEKELIHNLYYKNLTVRQVGEREKVSHAAIVKRHKKVLDKLRRYFL